MLFYASREQVTFRWPDDDNDDDDDVDVDDDRFVLDQHN